MSKPGAEASVIVLALLNPATADPIRYCLCSPLMSNKGVCRTAPATPGLLNIYYILYYLSLPSVQWLVINKPDGRHI